MIFFLVLMSIWWDNIKPDIFALKILDRIGVHKVLIYFNKT